MNATSDSDCMSCEGEGRGQNERKKEGIGGKRKRGEGNGGEEKGWEGTRGEGRGEGRRREGRG